MTDEEIEALAKHWFELSNQPPFTWETSAPFVCQFWREAARKEYEANPELVRRQLEKLEK